MLFRGICGNISAYGKRQTQKDKKRTARNASERLFCSVYFLIPADTKITRIVKKNMCSPFLSFGKLCLEYSNGARSFIAVFFLCFLFSVCKICGAFCSVLAFKFKFAEIVAVIVKSYVCFCHFKNLSSARIADSTAF